MQRNVCWPRDLLKDDAPTCRIFTWGYDSSVANITQAASHATIFGHSESLLQDICLSRTSKDEAERPLVFVGHSLGGLVIKEALIRSSEYYFNEQDEELGAVYACTKGIVFLGTPHRGSELTPYGHIVAKVAKLLLRNPNDKLISLLETESPILERQRRSFASISKDIGLACVIEELPTALGIVVPEWSATIDGFNVKYQQVPANHMDMCKFATREEIGYKRVVFLLKNILKRKFHAKPIFRQKVTRTFNYGKTWSWEELKMALQAVLEEKPPNFELIFFVDGLDEYRPMEKFPQVFRFDNVKVVVSSRPLLIFRDTFRPFPSIALHTLTANDISSYVADRLANNEGLAQLTVLRPSFEEDVKKEILGKADGVFLWVRLVLDLLTQGLRDGDTVDELLDKLRGMPKQLGGKKGLYMAMLLNLPVEYRKQGYEYFQMLQRSEVDLDPLMLSFAMEDPQVVFTTPIERITDAEIDIRRKRTSDRLLSRCGGLLETRGSSWSPRINFIHQTAKEFAGKRSNWEHLLQTGDFTNFDGALALLRASVVMLKRTAPIDGIIPHLRNGGESRWKRLQVCLRCARAAESLSAGPTAELLLLVDKTMFYLERPRLYQHPTSPPSQQRSSGAPNFDELLSNYQMTTHGGTIRRGTQYVAGHWSVVEPSEIVNPGDKNFIAVAVQSNLDAFVGLASKNKRIVDSLFHTDYPLLAYALVPHRVRDSVAGASMLEGNPSLPEMTRVLLELGLDPNQRYDGPSYLPPCTVWEGFLANGDLILDPWLEGPPDYSKEADNDAYRIWLANARLLVQHGADPNAICIIRRQKTLGPPPKKYDRRSALYCVILGGKVEAG
ncbi:hypothetical protein NEMBOFW57_003559 [Staphylotrichum longicolle]|uniref:DUF7791 domain-containing protein n=1 Tax=Staphylotrichum longicolle TaxID=669026 RepID=A0AAD4I2T6_9PEZI|nr:hypothetical protein NEMBOFW57_003559 [Staphylotrichum longicolle]